MQRSVKLVAAFALAQVLAGGCDWCRRNSCRPATQPACCPPAAPILTAPPAGAIVAPSATAVPPPPPPL